MANTTQRNDHPLTKFRDSNLILEDDRMDIRGRKVVDPQGKTLGHVRALYVDEIDRKVRMLDIAGGGFLGIEDQHFLVPIDAVTKVTATLVHVNESGERVLHSPAYDPTLIAPYQRSYWEPYYGYYGRSPYWDTSYRYPNYSTWF
jgi:sporulation protein YlmC with PRC-barrel domain